MFRAGTPQTRFGSFLTSSHPNTPGVQGHPLGFHKLPFQPRHAPAGARAELAGRRARGPAPSEGVTDPKGWESPWSTTHAFPFFGRQEALGAKTVPKRRTRTEWAHRASTPHSSTLPDSWHRKTPSTSLHHCSEPTRLVCSVSGQVFSPTPGRD